MLLFFCVCVVLINYLKAYSKDFNYFNLIMMEKLNYKPKSAFAMKTFEKT